MEIHPKTQPGIAELSPKELGGRDHNYLCTSLKKRKGIGKTFKKMSVHPHRHMCTHIDPYALNLVLKK